MLDKQEYKKLLELLDELDAEITAVWEQGVLTSDLTAKIDAVYEYAQELREQEEVA